MASRGALEPGHIPEDHDQQDNVQAAPAQRQENHRDDDNDGNAEAERPRRRMRRAMQAERIPLHDLLQLLAGQRVVLGEATPANSNEELVSQLRRSGMLSR